MVSCSYKRTWCSKMSPPLHYNKKYIIFLCHGLRTCFEHLVKVHEKRNEKGTLFEIYTSEKMKGNRAQKPQNNKDRRLVIINQ